ncbi:hypothetical protein EWM64_g1685 [Hericium alpestre]|uniref:Pal1 cell morphology protein n=1 Tax=Hericium alpestre TaxID=135208 RepID=A0A4Z0A7K6_9AGAM|nr:hypothetical protein EWM64_g1685 [Hericium alpestre]
MPDRSSSVRRSHSRHRSQSDPFSDPLYAAPPSAPIPPPKHYPASRHAARPSTADRPRHRDRDHRDRDKDRSKDRVMEAVKDTVTVRNADLPPRTRPSRSQTSAPPSHTTSTHARPPPTVTRRSHSEDTVPQHAAADKGKSNGKKAPKKGSVHADVIDRLDFTGMGPMFHHDGPFDACAPSRNVHRTKAPMYAWTGVNAEDEQAAAKYRNGEPVRAVPSLTYESPYPTAELAKGMSNASYYAEPPKKKVDAIAEAWGTHEPEPYEEFFAGGGKGDASAPNSIRHGRHGNDGRRGRDGRREVDEGRSRGNKRSAIPPPQPIFVPDGTVTEPESWPALHLPIGGLVSSTGGNGRFSDAARPTHKSQNSFLGRFGRTGRDNASPTSEAYVYVEDPKMKDLPATPDTAGMSPSYENERGYFDAAPASGATGLGRKTSLLKKVKGVMMAK